MNLRPVAIRATAALASVVFNFSIAAADATAELFEEKPVGIREVAPGVMLVDFGRVAFGNLELRAPEDAEITVHFGEAFEDGRINRQPPGTVRYAEVSATLNEGPGVVAPPADERNTKQPKAVLTPSEWGVVLPFRWVEIEGWPGDLKPDQVTRRSAFLAGWNDGAASFESSDATLDAIWELCRYSVKATTFAGVYVDGDRERIPYEADAYLNQLCHYFVDPDKRTARDTFDRLMEYPTWPTEWAPHMVFIAHADWVHTGDAAWLKPRYESLKSKLLLDRAGEDLLIRSNQRQIKRDDIVDWPKGERDGYVFREVNTVVNAFHISALRKMADLAGATGHREDEVRYRDRADRVLERFNEVLLIEDKGIYRDGVGTDHTSLHASLFPLAFGLIPEDHVPAVVDFLVEKGMKCSVYAAQYLMEGLFENGAANEALELILADGDRSWKHMLESGTTITWEAWDQKYKPNQDWNHAWGAAPANLLPRYVLGVRPHAPGWEVAGIRPHLGSLTGARGRVPTPKGPVEVRWQREGDALALKLEAPQGMRVRLSLPPTERAKTLVVNGSKVAIPEGGEWVPLPAGEGDR
jgi:hypothetical protein